jgi:hypothetical protein
MVDGIPADSGPRPLMLMDFDGVINFSASINAYRKHDDAFGYVNKTRLSCDGHPFDVHWSAQLVRGLNQAKVDAGAGWLWLSTWQQCAVTEIDRELGTLSDGFIAWDSFSEPSVAALAGGAAQVRIARKYEQVLKQIAANPRPFVWIDDDLAPLYVARDFEHDFDVPHLVVSPEEQFGMTSDDLRRVTEFLASLSNSV